MTFADTADAVAASTEMIDSKMGKSLKKFLTKNIIKKELKDKVRGLCALSRATGLCWDRCRLRGRQTRRMTSYAPAPASL